MSYPSTHTISTSKTTRLLFIAIAILIGIIIVPSCDGGLVRKP